MTGADDTLSRTFAALAHPARRQILARLRAGEASVQEIGAPLSLSGPALTKHLEVLERSGLIHRTRQARYRPARLDPRPLEDAASFIAEIREVREDDLDRLQAHLESRSEEEEHRP